MRRHPKDGSQVQVLPRSPAPAPLPPPSDVAEAPPATIDSLAGNVAPPDPAPGRELEPEVPSGSDLALAAPAAAPGAAPTADVDAPGVMHGQGGNEAAGLGCEDGEVCCAGGYLGRLVVGFDHVP